MSYDVYWVKNRADKIADFEHPTSRGNTETEVNQEKRHDTILQQARLQEMQVQVYRTEIQGG